MRMRCTSSAKLATFGAPLRGGLATVCDAGVRNSAGLQAIEQAAAETGIRCVLGLICHDETALAGADRFLARRAPLLHPALAVAIPEAVDDALLHATSRLAAEAGAVFQVHVNEHLARWSVRWWRVVNARCSTCTRRARWARRRCWRTARCSRRTRCCCCATAAARWP